MPLTLEALQANDGDCLLLVHEHEGHDPVRILIDGGSRGIYTRVLRPRIDALRGAGRLDLRMVMVSHIDADHITGVLDLFRDMERRRDNGEDAFCHVRTLWHNSFEMLHQGRIAPVESAVVSAAVGGAPPPGLTPFAAAVVTSVRQGADLRGAAQRLDVPLNEGAGDDLVRAPQSEVRRLPVAPGLTFTILGPTDAQLKKLDREWQKAKADHPGNPAAQAADYLNRTVPNLSSIVVLVEAAHPGGGGPVRLLLTGDAGGDHILTAIEQAGLGDGGRLHVDLLKVQHHGSNHSVTEDFFERVTADRYVISGNGRHGNPHGDTLGWLSHARSGQPYEAYLTNREGGDGLTAMLDGFLAREARDEPGHQYHFRDDDAPGLAVMLP
jgi:hypothetical protein